MKILVLTAAYPSPSEPERAVFIENITRALVAPQGDTPPLEATVLAPRCHPADPLEEVRHGVRISRFRYPAGGRRLKEWDRTPLLRVGAWVLSGIRTTLREVRRERPDLLLAHWVLPTGLVGAVAARRSGLPLVLLAHGSDIHRYATRSRLAAFLARRALRAAARIATVSRELQEILEERFDVSRESMRVISMGVDGSLFAPLEAAESEGGRAAGQAEARRRLGREPTGPLLLFVGDLTPAKGLPELLEAHEGLLRSGLQVTLAMAGEGPLRGEAERHRARWGRLELLGRVSQKALVDWYRASDLLVLPSRSEGLPVTVLEALSVGAPVVATRVGGIPEVVVEGETGRLVPPTDPAALEQALRETLQPEVLARLREGVARSRLDHSAASRGAELEALIHEAAGEPARVREPAGEAAR